MGKDTISYSGCSNPIIAGELIIKTADVDHAKPDREVAGWRKEISRAHEHEFATIAIEYRYGWSKIGNQKFRRFIVFGLGNFILYSVIFSILLTACCLTTAFLLPKIKFPEFFLCRNSIQQSVISPNGKFKAVAFLRDCGATTSYTPHVSILKADEKLTNENGNVFIGSYGEDFINVDWLSDNKLIIYYSTSAYKPTLKLDTLHSIGITYDEIIQDK